MRASPCSREGKIPGPSGQRPPCPVWGAPAPWPPALSSPANAPRSSSLGSTQAALAEDLGTVREVALRALRQLTEAGAIERDGRRIRVIHPDLLERHSR